MRTKVEAIAQEMDDLCSHMPARLIEDETLAKVAAWRDRLVDLLPREEAMTETETDETQLLYLRPAQRRSAEPVIDGLTRKMAAAYRAAESNGVLWRGFHICRCGARSTNTDYTLPGGATTNSLCVHYLAFHRDEVPEAELAKVAALTSGEAEPNAEELATPPPPRRPDSR